MKSRLLIRKTSSFIVQSGFGKDRSILMRYRLNQTGLSIKTELYILDYREALHIEKIRNEFFVQLQELLQKQQGRDETG